MRKLLAILVVLAVAAIAVGLIFLKKNGVVLDSAEVERSAATMLPGARPPAGLKGVLGLHLEGLEVAIFAPSLDQVKTENLNDSGLRIVIARPTSSDPPSPQDIAEKIAKARKERAEEMETQATRPVLLPVGGKPYPALESSLSMRSNGKKMRQESTIFPIDKKPVVVLIMGPQQTFNLAARDQFLATLTAPDAPHPHLPKIPQRGEPPKLPAMPVARLPKPPGPPTPKRPAFRAIPRPKLARPHPPGPGPGRIPGPPRPSGDSGPPGPGSGPPGF